MAKITFYIKQNDTRPVLEVFLRDERDRAVDITGATVVFHLRNASDDTNIISSGTVTVVNSVNGQVRYSWSATDTATALVGEAEFQVTFIGDAVETFPNDGYIKVIILDDVV